MDEKRIVAMAQLATYEKRYARIDRKRLAFFREDYVYKRNFVTRLYVILGTLVALAARYSYLAAVTEENVFLSASSADYALRALIAVVIIYSVIGTLKRNYEYALSENRFERYQTLIKNLEQASLEQTSLEQASLEQTSLEQTNLKQASLEQTNLKQASLEQTNLKQASLGQINLEQTNLEQTNLEQTDLGRTEE
jgi:uncharacterized protein YjbI with pentapeptide repeats